MVFRACPHCDYRTEKASTMSMHIKIKHVLDKEHVCPFCMENFSTRSQLQHHLRNNHYDAEIPCRMEGCTHVFKDECAHKMHYVRHHMKHLKHELYQPSKSKGFSHCLTCGKMKKNAAMVYHVACCSPLSPFSKNYVATCLPCSDDEEICTEKLPHMNEEELYDFEPLCDFSDLDDDFLQSDETFLELVKSLCDD